MVVHSYNTLENENNFLWVVRKQHYAKNEKHTTRNELTKPNSSSNNKRVLNL